MPSPTEQSPESMVQIKAKLFSVEKELKIAEENCECLRQQRYALQLVVNMMSDSQGNAK